MARIFGQHEEQTPLQLRRVEQNAERAALMADGHLGYVMPIGGVAAYRERVSVVGVGFDIACGNAALRTDRTVEQLSGFSVEELQSNPSRTWGNRRLGRLADEIRSTVSFGIGRSNRADDAPVDHPLFASDAWQLVPTERGLRDTLMDRAREQLGTVGSGNHYVDVFYDDEGFVWVGVHFGSRGFAWRETHEIGGEPTEVIVVRKGATPAFPGQKGFVGGSMADDAVIVRGAPDGGPDAADALYSTVHGAGRVMSRTAAAGKRHRRTGRILSPGRVTPEAMEARLRKKGVVLRGGGLDESPQVYRRLSEVLAAQGPTIEVLHTLHPLIVVMAGPDVRDPYKD